MLPPTSLESGESQQSFFNPLFPPFDIAAIKAGESVLSAVPERKGWIIHDVNPTWTRNGYLMCESSCGCCDGSGKAGRANAHHGAEAKKIQCNEQECSEKITQRRLYPSSLVWERGFQRCRVRYKLGCALRAVRCLIGILATAIRARFHGVDGRYIRAWQE